MTKEVLHTHQTVPFPPSAFLVNFTHTDLISHSHVGCRVTPPGLGITWNHFSVIVNLRPQCPQWADNCAQYSFLTVILFRYGNWAAIEVALAYRRNLVLNVFSMQPYKFSWVEMITLCQEVCSQRTYTPTVPGLKKVNGDRAQNYFLRTPLWVPKAV